MLSSYRQVEPIRQRGTTTPSATGRRSGLFRSRPRSYNADMDHPLVAFDVETVPDPELGRRLHGLSGSDGEVIGAMLARRREETGDRTDFHPHPFHRVVMVSLARLDPLSGRFSLVSPGGGLDDEASHLEGFARVLAEPVAPRLVSWNGRGFDLSVMRYRAMVRGIAMPELYQPDPGGGANRYQGREAELHVDLMDLLSGYGASPRTRLDDLSRILELPGKTVTEGSRVAEHFGSGEEAVVRDYCQEDALGTLLLYLVWCVHAGSMAPRRLAALVGRIADALEATPGETAPALGARLRGWPRWAHSG